VGCRWCDLPTSFPPKSTVHHRFQVWQKLGFFEALFERLKSLKAQKKQELYRLDATITRLKITKPYGY
jgi:transposase